MQLLITPELTQLGSLQGNSPLPDVAPVLTTADKGLLPFVIQNLN
jgi:hypothetical protein